MELLLEEENDMKQKKKAVAAILYIFIGLAGLIRLFMKEGQSMEEMFYTHTTIERSLETDFEVENGTE